MPSVSVTLEVSHCEISALKEVAEQNSLFIVVALEVSHAEISSLKEPAASVYESQYESLAQKSASKLVALDVSHVEMCPYLASVVVASLSHSSTAPESVESSNDDPKLFVANGSITSSFRAREAVICLCRMNRHGTECERRNRNSVARAVLAMALYSAPHQVQWRWYTG